MIIDIHSHIADFRIYPELILNGIVNDGSIDNKKLSIVLKMFLKDKDCSSLLKQMDETNIEKCVLQIIDFSDKFGKTDLSIEEIYELHYEVLKNYPDRFIVFGGFHPERGKYGEQLFKKSIEKYGFKGLKIYPPLGYPINDKRLYRCYEICNDNYLNILIHTGFSASQLFNEYSEPYLVKEVAQKFPHCNFILGHAGYKLNDPGIRSLLEIENVYADISGFQSILKNNQDCNFEFLLDDKYNQKILYGSDWPITNLIKPLKQQIDLLKNIFLRLNFDLNIIQNIFYTNSLNILRLNK